MTSSPSVLLVTAASVLADIYVRRFERQGWDAYVVGELGEAERKAVRLRPTVLMIDADTVTGVVNEITRLKRLPTLMKTSIIIFAKHATHAFVHDALAAGAHDVILTPHTKPTEVVDRIHSRYVKN